MICYLGIGSNLGNRENNIKAALKKINSLKATKVLKVSRLIRTMPVGGPKGQEEYLNGAVKLSTGLSALKLLVALKKIERELGRKKAVRNAPRQIDLDILLFGSKIINTKKLIIPHPRMFERDFVLKPLSEVL